MWLKQFCKLLVDAQVRSVVDGIHIMWASCELDTMRVCGNQNSDEVSPPLLGAQTVHGGIWWGFVMVNSLAGGVGLIYFWTDVGREVKGMKTTAHSASRDRILRHVVGIRCVAPTRSVLLDAARRRASSSEICLTSFAISFIHNYRHSTQIVEVVKLTGRPASRVDDIRIQHFLSLVSGTSINFQFI